DSDEPWPARTRCYGRVDRLCHLPHRHIDGGRRGSLRQIIRALHLLSATARQRLVLLGRNPPHFGSIIWVRLMIRNMIAWKRDNPAKPVPLAMFAITATAMLWAWSASGVELEMIGVVLPRAFGLSNQIDAGLARTLFSVTLHSIVYFWLMPAYIA